MKDSKAAKLIALAYGEGRTVGYSEGCRMGGAEDADERAEEAFEQGRITGLEQGRREALSDEALASAKSAAYEAGYKKGVEDQGRKTLELMAEARESERQKIEDAQPKLSVWFRPCGPSPESPETYPPGLDKIKAIKAIRQAYVHAEGYGLKEVKDMVEMGSPCARYAAGEPLPQSKAVELYLALRAAGFDPVLRAQD